MEHQEIIFYIATPVLGWLALTTIQHGKRIEVLQTSQTTVNNVVTQAMENIKELKGSFEKLSGKIDTFMYSEKESFKEIVRENTEAIKNMSKKT